MVATLQNRRIPGGPGRRFLIGPPQDSDEVLQLFALVLEKADEERKAGKRFGVPFAALLKLGNRNSLSFDQLARFARDGTPKSGDTRKDYPAVWRRVSVPIVGSGGTASLDVALPPATVTRAAMFFDLLQFAVELSTRFNLQPPQICRVMAAVGQTLDAQDSRFRQKNRSLADRHRAAARKRLSFAPAAPLQERVRPLAKQEESQLIVKTPAPWQVEFRRREEQAACLRLESVVLWHASYVGPRTAEKLENQDATFAMTTPAMSSPPYLLFALADGVTSSLGSRLAATSIVRGFCECVSQQISKEEEVTGSGLIDAARKTQTSLEGLARSLLQDVKSFSFESMLGSELKRTVAIRVLQNTLDPKVAAMPPALNATLIGGVVQAQGDLLKIVLLRIGDGSVEHIDVHGNVTVIMATDPGTVAISEAMGPGPQSRALFEPPARRLSTACAMLASGESLIISSDGLARGHDQSITRKLQELLGEPFWKKARPDEADAALQILHRACVSADESCLHGPEGLFADNVSMILIRRGD
jgi:Protein phosphatase 2C